MNRRQFNAKKKDLADQALALRRKAAALDRQAYDLEQKYRQVCTHPSTKIVTKSYEEPGRVKYYEWREKVCTVCGETVATESEETKRTWNYH